MDTHLISIASGSSGNCTIVKNDNTTIMIDLGTGLKYVEQKLDEININKNEINGILLTHAHIDHYKSVGRFSLKYNTKIFTEKPTYETIISKDFKNPIKKVKNIFSIPDRIGSIDIISFPVSHGGLIPAGYPVGFVFYSNSKKIGYLTDVGEVSNEGIELLKGCNEIFIEANYDRKIIESKLSNKKFFNQWWYLNWVNSPLGHLSNEQTAEALDEIVTNSTEKIFLGHMSINHNDYIRDNNQYTLARSIVINKLKNSRSYLPNILPTYRVGKFKTLDEIDLFSQKGEGHYA